MNAQEQELEAQRYPVGRFNLSEMVTPAQRENAIVTLEAFPLLLRGEVTKIGFDALNRAYRPGGWTIGQLVNHIADSHSQMSGRLRMALTEDWPTIKPYDQAAWAELIDASSPEPAMVGPSLDIVEGVHARVVTLLRSLREEDWKRGFHHPENGPERLDQVLLRYEWHSRHHLAHVQNAPR